MAHVNVNGAAVTVPIRVVPVLNSTWEIVPSVSVAVACNTTFVSGGITAPLAGAERTAVGAAFAWTVIVTDDEGLFPVASYALAVSWYVPFAGFTSVALYGAVADAPMRVDPPRKNRTSVMGPLPLAVALAVITMSTGEPNFWPAVGDVIDTDVGVACTACVKTQHRAARKPKNARSATICCDLR